MANNLSINPMYLDTLGVVKTNRIIITGIVPVSSNATWSVILQDQNSNVIFSANNTTGGSNNLPPKSIESNGLKVATLTAAAVLVYYSNLE